MNKYSTIQLLSPSNNPKDITNGFLNDVEKGLSSKQKYIPQKYLYDKIGSELFKQITYHPDYYLTACELEIINSYKDKISDLVTEHNIDVAELGPGEGVKSQLLLESLLQNQVDFHYYPIDISISYLEEVRTKINKKLDIQITPIQSDFFQGIQWLNEKNSKNKLILFLGNSIGNLSDQETTNFFSSIRNSMRQGDFILIGYDLIKDKETLMRAYNDSYMLSRDFYLNILHRINSELNANFDINNFAHYCKYNKRKKAIEDFLISNQDQSVNIDNKLKFTFKKGESIHTDTSHKYSLKQMHDYATAAGFKLIEDFIESKNFFADSLWQYSK